jgi:hypothetical protein
MPEVTCLKKYSIWKTVVGGEKTLWEIGGVEESCFS